MEQTCAYKEMLVDASLRTSKTVPTPTIPLLAGSDLSINGTRDCVENRISTRAVILTAEAVGDVPLTSNLDSSRTPFVLSVSSGRAANSREA